jgi:hypothetical protein
MTNGLLSRRFCAVSCIGVAVLSGCAMPRVAGGYLDPGCTASPCTVSDPVFYGLFGSVENVRAAARDYCAGKGYGPPEIWLDPSQTLVDQIHDNRYLFKCSAPKSSATSPSGAVTSVQPTYQVAQPTYQVVQPTYQVAQPKSATTSSEGRASCNIGDGYQTVRFTDGAVYSGSFKGCKPLAGPAQYQQGTTVLNGNAEPVDDRTVRLRSGNSVATITLQIVSH